MVSLEPFEKCDYSRLISWVDTAETLLQFAGPAFSFPLTVDQLDESCSNPARMCFKLVLTNSGQVIGHSEIYLLEGTGWLGRILIGDPSQRGQGLGGHTVKALLQLCFERLICEEVRLNVFDRNRSAIRCYERCGFTVNADARFQRTVGEQVWIGRQMMLLKKDWNQLRLAK